MQVYHPFLEKNVTSGLNDIFASVASEMTPCATRIIKLEEGFKRNSRQSVDNLVIIQQRPQIQVP